MRYVNSKLAREVARLYDWHDHVWARRYQAIVVSDEPEAQEARLRYLLSQGVKEGLVAHPAEWPGATSVRALTGCEGESIEGVWFDRTKEFFARRRQEDYERRTYASSESMRLLPLPCWRAFSREVRIERVFGLIEDIVREGRTLRRGRAPLGVDRILRQRPHDRPSKSKRSPAPRFHAATTRVRKALRAAYRDFVAAYRRAARWLRESGSFGMCPFPSGCFPPALPFVGG